MPVIQSPFIAYHKKYLRGIAKAAATTVNGSTKPLRYIFKERTRAMYAPTDQWEVLQVNLNRVAADYIALDAQEPMKIRSTFKKYSGDLPKLGMALQLKESEMKRIRLITQERQGMLALAASTAGSNPQLSQEYTARAADLEASIVRIIFADTQQCVTGVMEAHEDAFLRLLSSGQAVIADNDRPGYGLALTLELSANQKVDVKTSWGDGSDAAVTKAAKTVSDVMAEIKKIRRAGGTVASVALSENVLDIIAASDEGKQCWANGEKRLYTSINNVSVPDNDEMAAALAKRWKVDEVVSIPERVIKYEKDGKQKTVTPFEEKNIVLLPSTQYGTFWYGTVEEMLSPEAGVSYTTVENHILVSVKRTGDPLKEKTRSQAVAIPMLDNVEKLVWINTRPSAPEPEPEPANDGGEGA